jgi:transglutaminase-like putative cysteine protease
VRRTALLGSLAALLLSWAWLRLELREQLSSVLLWALAAGVAPALPTSWRLRAAAVAVSAVVVLEKTLGSVRPGIALERFGDGFRLFFDVQLPFVPAFHPKMHGLVLLGVVGFTLAVTLAVAARRPLLAGGLLVAGAGWPATLLHGERPLRDGAIILGAVLLIVAGIGSAVRARQAAVAGALVIGAAVGIAAVPAVAKGAFLAWEKWDPYATPERQVSVSYVWDTTYQPLTFPKKKTVVFRVQAPPVSRYWRATTLDMFHGQAWIEYPHQTYREPPRFTPLLPGSARNPQRQLRVRVEVAGLQDTHLIGPSVPVDFETDFETVLYQDTGTAIVPEGIPRGSSYNAISFLPRPSPERLLRSRPIYGPYHELYREVQSRTRTSLPPALGVPDRDARMNTFFRQEQLVRNYRPLYDIARQVVGTTTSPYLAAVRLEDWFRTGGGFSYDASPPSQNKLPTLVHFLTRSRSGYCQHFASAMTLMLRYLGVPSRVAAGFTSGTYDQKTREWTVTDHDAHTWVEVWFRGFGWLPFDPTPGRGTLDGSYSAASNRFDPATLAALGAGLDAADRKLDGGGLDRLGRQGTDSARDVPGEVATTTREDASLFRLLVLLALGLLATVAVAKQAWRHARFLTRDPRRTAAACRRELADFLADQRFVVPPSATVAELGEIARHELGVNPETFVSAVGAARYDRPERAETAARAARRELRRLRHDIRRRLSRFERARGLVSLRSFGVA